MMISSLRIEGMHCGHCVGRVAEALRAIEGVSEVQVALDEGRANVRHEGDVTESTMREAISRAGYETVGFESAGA